MLAAAGGDAALAFIEIGALALGLSMLARLADRVGLPAVPFYLVAGLAVGEGGVVRLDVSADFISLTAEIGVLLLLLTLGLEYTGDELRQGLRTGRRPGMVDAVANFSPGFGMALLLGWDLESAVLLGGASWVSSSGVVATILTDLNRLGNRETPAILNLLVVEDLAMAAFLPVVAALVAGEDAGTTTLTVAVALVVVAAIVTMAIRWGQRISSLVASESDEALLLAVFGLTLLVGGLAQQVQVSAAIGAFLVGLALSGPVQERAGALVEPLRHLFAASFFVFFSFQIDPGDLVGALAPAIALTVVAGGTKFVSGWAAGRSLGVGVRGQRRAGAALVARGEFSVIIASLAAGTAHGDDLGALTAAFVLLSAVAAPLLSKYIERLPVSAART